MSVKVTAWVWEHSRAEKSVELLVHLAFADYAHDDGGGSFPSVDTVAKKARTSRRTALRCIQSLLDRGELEFSGKTPRGTKIYRVVMGVPKWHSAPHGGDSGGTSEGDKTDAGGDTGGTRLSIGEPLKEPLKEPSGEKPTASPVSEKPKKSAPRDTFKPSDDDPVDVAIVEVFEHWAKGTGDEKARLTQNRASKIRARLREKGKLHEGGRDVALAEARREILFAVDGMIHSKWHRDNGQLDFLLMFRDEDRITFFANKRKAQVDQEQAKPSGNGDFAAYKQVVERG